MLEQKIENLIEEAILEKINNSIKNFLKNFGAIPNNILNNIKRKFKVKTLEEVSAPAGAKRIEGETDSRDTCYTSIMKLIGQERLPKKYPTLADFMDAYHKKVPNPPTADQIKVQNMKPGTVIFIKREEPSYSDVNRGYSQKFGVYQKEERVVGHMLIYLGEDPNKGQKKYVTLHNAWVGDDREVAGAGLELSLDHDGAGWFNKKHKSSVLELLDYNKIKNM